MAGRQTNFQIKALKQPFERFEIKIYIKTIEGNVHSFFYSWKLFSKNKVFKGFEKVLATKYILKLKFAKVLIAKVNDLLKN